MYAIVGITGRVGSAVGENLLAQGEQIRAIVRDSQGAARWRDRGAEVAVADVHDSNALASAFEGIDGVFLMIPPNFAPAPGVTVESIQKFRLETLAVQCTNREIGQMLRTGTYHHVSQREIASDKRISRHLSVSVTLLLMSLNWPPDGVARFEIKLCLFNGLRPLWEVGCA
jgi:predicted dinucleotide-binding enzyme